MEPLVTGYDRATVDAFFAAADAERGRLMDQIATARRRVASARAELTNQHALTSMIRSVLEEIGAKQRQAAIIVSRLGGEQPSTELSASEPSAPVISWHAPEAITTAPRTSISAGAR